MVTFLLLNSIFCAGAFLIAATMWPRGLDRIFAASILGFTIIVLTIILLSPLGGVRFSLLSAVCVVVFLLGLALHISRRGIRGLGRSLQWRLVRRHDVAALALVAITLWGALHYLLYGWIWPVAPISDAPIYHLPFALHWWQAGKLDFVPTPFGEEGATYFPANGELWLTWLAVTSDGSSIIKVGQWPFLAMGAAALYALGRQQGGSRYSSIVPASCWCVMPLALTESALANVDLIWTAYYFIGLYYLVRITARLQRGRTARREAMFLGLSLGIVLGTKSIGLLWVPMLIAPAIWHWARTSQFSAEPMLRRAWLHLGLVATGLVIPSAYWFFRNFWATGNPLYPLHVAPFGFTMLPGWYTRSAMLNTGYHIPIWRLDILINNILVVAGAVPTLLWCAGVFGGFIGYWKLPRPANRTVSGFALLALFHLLVFWIVIPYNTQIRFLLAGLGIGLLPLAVWLKRWPSLLPIFIVAIVVHLFVAGTTSPGRGAIVPLAHNPLSLDILWAAVALPLALLIASVLWHHNSAVARASALLAIVCGSYLYAYPANEALLNRPNERFFPRGSFGNRMYDAWLIVEQLSGQGLNVAYTGTNLPYYLYGSRLRNTVVYVNVNAHPDWLAHDYHREHKRIANLALSDDPWPQWYRRDFDYSAWLENLRRAKVQLLIVARENQHGRKTTFKGLPPFPIEKQWADAHPECFEDLGPRQTAADEPEWARVYRLRSAQ